MLGLIAQDGGSCVGWGTSGVFRIPPARGRQPKNICVCCCENKKKLSNIKLSSMTQLHQLELDNQHQRFHSIDLFGLSVTEHDGTLSPHFPGTEETFREVCLN